MFGPYDWEIRNQVRLEQALKKALKGPHGLSLERMREIGEGVYGEDVDLVRVTPSVGLIGVVPRAVLEGDPNAEIMVLNPFNGELVKARRGGIRIDEGL